MTHVNTQVRAAVAGAMGGIAGLTVFTSRSANLLHTHLPAAVVGTGTDEVRPDNKGDKDRGPSELRTVALTVVLVLDGDSETLDDDADELRAGVEAAVNGALGLARQVRHTGGELEMGSDEEGDRWFAFYALGWEVDVETEIGSPEVAL